MTVDNFFPKDGSDESCFRITFPGIFLMLRRGITGYPSDE